LSYVPLPQLEGVRSKLRWGTQLRTPKNSYSLLVSSFSHQ